MYEVVSKELDDDLDVVFEGDNWVGANATILKGSIIGACAVVTKDVPSYAIVAGNPAKVVGTRFSPEEIVRHEIALGAR